MVAALKLGNLCSDVEWGHRERDFPCQATHTVKEVGECGMVQQ